MSPRNILDFIRANAIAISGASLLVIATIIIVLYQEQDYRAQKLSEVKAQADVLADSVSASLVFEDHNAAQEYISALRNYPDLDVAAVYDSQNHIFAGITRSRDTHMPQHAGPSAAYYESDRVFVTKSAVQNGISVGKVFLQVTIDSAKARIVRYLGISVVVTMAILMLSVLGVLQQTLARTNVKLRAEMIERSRMEETLRQSHKMEALGQMAGGIAHDFNNLLAIIRGSIQMLRRKLGPLQADAQRFMDTAFDGVDRAALVTQRILAFSRRQTLHQQSVALDELIENILPLVRQSVGSSIEVKTQLHSSWMTLCDVSQMENVIINLAINARDAMKDGGQLTIVTSDMHLDDDKNTLNAGDYVRVEIQDTGAGMPEDVRQRAFDPFFTTKGPGKGTGLGLSMALGFVNQSHGYLLIDSEIGCGTMVTILMPRHQEQSAG